MCLVWQKNIFVLICSGCNSEHITQFVRENSGFFEALDVVTNGTPNELKLLHESGNRYVLLQGGIRQPELSGMDGLSLLSQFFEPGQSSFYTRGVSTGAEYEFCFGQQIDNLLGKRVVCIRLFCCGVAGCCGDNQSADIR